MLGGCGVCPPPSKQLESDTLEYDIGVHDRLFEDGLFAMQARQIVILDRPDTADDLKFETIFWVNLKKRLLEPED
jgi:hypothetical protein